MSQSPSIIPIEKTEFDKFHPARRPTTIMYSEEVEWYADESKTLLGVVIWDRSDEDFAYLGRRRVLQPEREVDKGHFAGVAQYWVEDGNVAGYAPQFDALTSVTRIFSFESAQSAEQFDTKLVEEAANALEKERLRHPE